MNKKLVELLKQNHDKRNLIKRENNLNKNRFIIPRQITR